MKSYRTLPAALLALVFAGLLGCGTATLPRVRYEGVITRVEEPDGRFLSPWKGDKPLLVLDVQLSAPTNGALARPARRVMLRTLDLYSPRAHGAVGDHISFTCAGTLPVDRDLWFEQIRDYHVLRRGP